MMCSKEHAKIIYLNWIIANRKWQNLTLHRYRTSVWGEKLQTKKTKDLNWFSQSHRQCKINRCNLLTASNGCSLKNNCMPNTALCMHTGEKLSIKYESVCWVSILLWLKYHSKCKTGTNLCLVNSICTHKSQFALTVLGYIVDKPYISAEFLANTSCPLCLMTSPFPFTLGAWVLPLLIYL